MTIPAYCIMVSDGEVFRTLHGPAFGADRAALEALIRRALEPPPAAAPAPASPKPRPPAPALTAAEPLVPRREPVSPTMTQAEMARVQGYEGDPCDSCQQFKLKRAGHCMVCDACGTTTGCS